MLHFLFVLNNLILYKNWIITLYKQYFVKLCMIFSYGRNKVFWVIYEKLICLQTLPKLIQRSQNNEDRFPQHYL